MSETRLSEVTLRGPCSRAVQRFARNALVEHWPGSQCCVWIPKLDVANHRQNHCWRYEAVGLKCIGCGWFNDWIKNVEDAYAQPKFEKFVVYTWNTSVRPSRNCAEWGRSQKIELGYLEEKGYPFEVRSIYHFDSSEVQWENRARLF